MLRGILFWVSVVLAVGFGLAAEPLRGLYFLGIAAFLQLSLIMGGDE